MQQRKNKKKLEKLIYKVYPIRLGSCAEQRSGSGISNLNPEGRELIRDILHLRRDAREVSKRRVGRQGRLRILFVTFFAV